MLRCIQHGITFDYPHGHRREAEEIEYGLFGADRRLNSLIHGRIRIKYGTAKGRYGMRKLLSDIFHV
jgi:hypothetical protein